MSKRDILQVIHSFIHGHIQDLIQSHKQFRAILGDLFRTIFRALFGHEGHKRHEGHKGYKGHEGAQKMQRVQKY